jgi:plasmid stabilization system protein ParE
VTYSVYFTADARFDLDEIAEHIALESQMRALDFIDELQLRIRNTLSVAPNGGRRYKGESRFLSFSNTTVLYEVDDAAKEVMVLKIVGRGVDWRKD